MKKSAPPILAVSMGDPAGIGPEIIIKAWMQDPATMGHCCVAGDLQVMQRAMHVCRQALPAALASRMPQPVAVSEWKSGHHLGAGCIPVLQACETVDPLPVFGRVQREAGRMAASSIIAAAQAVLRDECAGMVTAPVHKEALAAAGVQHPECDPAGCVRRTSVLGTHRQRPASPPLLFDGRDLIDWRCLTIGLKRLGPSLGLDANLPTGQQNHIDPIPALDPGGSSDVRPKPDAQAIPVFADFDQHVRLHSMLKQC